MYFLIDNFSTVLNSTGIVPILFPLFLFKEQSFTYLQFLNQLFPEFIIDVLDLTVIDKSKCEQVFQTGIR